MTTISPKYIYGPVPSRRLGLSLGLDLVPYKVCSFNCIYCQVGRTTNLTTERREYFPIDKILDELKARLEQVKQVDYITLSGSGEPTLNSGFGKLVREIREITDIPIALLTNGSLFFLENVRADATLTDVVMPTLTAGSEEVFKQIHRSAKGVTLSKVVDGLAKFRQIFKGQIWLEIMLIKDINTCDSELEGIKGNINRIAPDKIQLNSPVRPPCEEFAKSPSYEELERIKDYFGMRAEIIVPKDRVLKIAGEEELAAAEIYAFLSRRPGRAKDLADSLGYHINVIVKTLDNLLTKGKIEIVNRGEEIFYRKKGN